MYHYLFTNDTRIMNLNTVLVKAGNDFLNDTIPTEKSENNNTLALGFFFNLTRDSNCAQLCAAGNVKAVVLNFIKMFQFPNPRTAESMMEAYEDGIQLAPLRVVLQILYFMRAVCPDEAYLTREEIRDFVFYNSVVAKDPNYNVFNIISQICRFRETGVYPESVETDEEKRVWKHEERQIRELTKILNWSGCAAETIDGKLFIEHDKLSIENKAAIFDILNMRSIWLPDPDDSYKDARKDYQNYFDIKDPSILDSGLLVKDKDGKYRVNRVCDGTNILLYGVPGSGKSFTVEHELCRGVKKENRYRLVFHPEYMYSDFVGQILPKVIRSEIEGGKDEVTYSFSPGPFTNVLKEAYAHPSEKYVLIIEEINRGNAPAIFGEIFQLLDRIGPNSKNKDNLPFGTSEYYINNESIADHVYGDKDSPIRIPSNLTILATMNTSDQNVFTLDTAFQRRWQMRQVENSFERVDKNLAEAQILDTSVKWEKFCSLVNKYILTNASEMSSTEDKRLGVFFVSAEDLKFDDLDFNKKDYLELCKKEYESLSEEEKEQLDRISGALNQNRRFPEKVLKYLWDDAFKFNTDKIFRKDINSLEKVIAVFMDNKEDGRFSVFNDGFKEELIGKDIHEND